MFKYCTDRLGFSEHVAFKRITAARLARKFPAVLRRIARGDVHLTAVKALAKILTAENHERVLAQAAGKKTWEVEILVASLAPKPDVPPQIRKLPQIRRALVERGGKATDARDARNGNTSDATDAGQLATANASRRPPSQAPNTPAPRPGEHGTVAPLSEDRFKVQFSASSALRDKLQRAEELLGPLHAGGVANGDIAGVVERALDELIEDLEKKRFAKTTRPQKKQRARKPGTRYVPRQVRREVAERDGGRCAFTDKEGRRCEEHRALEFHHQHAFALGGEATTANISLLCRAHNVLEAERDFGSKHMDRARRDQGVVPRRDRAAPGEARPLGGQPTRVETPPTLRVRDRWFVGTRLAASRTDPQWKSAAR